RCTFVLLVRRVLVGLEGGARRGRGQGGERRNKRRARERRRSEDRAEDHRPGDHGRKQNDAAPVHAAIICGQPQSRLGIWWEFWPVTGACNPLESVGV